MARRIQVRLACQPCRQKRAKCDGRKPCFRCQNDGRDCLYDKPRRESNLTLLAEIKRLKEQNAEKDKLLRVLTISHDVESCKAVVQKLKDGNRSRQDVLQAMNNQDSSNHRFRNRIRRKTPGIGPSDLAIGPEICQHCFSRLRTWNLPQFYPSDLSRPVEATAALLRDGLPAPAFLLPPPASGDTAQSQTDEWTQTGLRRAYVRQLLDILSTWDSLPGCIVCKAPFLEAYDTGSDQFCSTALVNAMLALATRVVVEPAEDETGLSLAGRPGSKQFSDSAEALLGNAKLASHLPDIQALGILSIYKISCGHETEAQMFAKLFLSRISDLYSRPSSAGKEDEVYNTVLTTTYCGGVSLGRMLRLISEHLFNLSNPTAAEEDNTFLDKPLCGTTRVTKANLGPIWGTDTHSSQLSGILLLGEKIFQLTEWVYKVLADLDPCQGNAAENDVLVAYTKCLTWYDDFFLLLKSDGSNTPSTLFIHMYYQFCLLLLFRPLVDVVPNDSLVQPQEICVQSAQAILSLAQCYDNLFTLRRVSGFIPYFVFASGQFNLFMHNHGIHKDSAHVGIAGSRTPHISPYPQEKETISRQYDSYGVSSHTNWVVGVTQARQLLEKMNSDYLALVMEKGMTGEEFYKGAVI